MTAIVYQKCTAFSEGSDSINFWMKRF